MSKASHRPNREQIKQQRKEKKKAERNLVASQKIQAVIPRAVANMPNSKSEYQSIDEERDARADAVTEQVRIFRAKLPVLLQRLSKIKDPRNPKKIKHKLTVLLIYGILTFVFQMTSRRQANREMTRPMFIENLKRLFPEIEDLPHNDTLMRLLSGIDVNQIESAHIQLVRKLIGNKKFYRYLIRNCYPVAFDGTQKFARDRLWSEECLERKAGEDQKQYYVYVLEASLAFRDGMTIPLMSEILNYAAGDRETGKQDCELKAFYRLAKRFKKEFPKLAVMILADGLYAKGPVMEICRKNKWQFMIVLKDKCLSSVWEEFNGLKDFVDGNRFRQIWGNRKQNFQWVNHIEYRYGTNGRKKQIVHVVVCNEIWQEVDEDAKVITKTARHAWISSQPISRLNVHELCNLGARNRWAIESGFLVEKRHGYQYEHCFSYDWNAMKGYHYLMRLGHMLNILSQYSERLAKIVCKLGARGFIHFVRETIAGPWLDAVRLQKRLSAPFQFRLI